ncbi:MAG: 6-bladed beta-propeller [Longimicrobiales bacterium]
MRHETRARPALPVLVAAFTVGVSAACGTINDRPAIAVRDRAGVTIIESRSAARPEDDDWRIEPEPVVDIGVTEGDEVYELGLVRSAFRLSDGAIVVADGASDELRVFDAQGRHTRTIGRRGQGPGEFRYLAGAYPLPGDSILAIDGYGSRWTRMDAHGNLASIALRPMTAGGPDGIFNDGTLLRLVYAGRVDPMQTGHVQDDIVFVLDRPAFVSATDPEVASSAPSNVFDPNEPRLQGDTILRVPGNQEYRTQVGNGIMNNAAAFGRQVRHVVGDDVLWVGGGETFEIRAHGMDGTLRRIVRLLEPNPPIEPEQIERWKLQQLEYARTDEQRRTRQRIIAAQEFPAVLPAYSALHIDRIGNLWVERYRVHRDDPQRWAVFDSEGAYLGTLDLPARFEVHEIYDDAVLGVWRDDADVQHVRLHRILKP